MRDVAEAVSALVQALLAHGCRAELKLDGVPVDRLPELASLLGCQPPKVSMSFLEDGGAVRYGDFYDWIGDPHTGLWVSAIGVSRAASEAEIRAERERLLALIDKRDA